MSIRSPRNETLKAIRRLRRRQGEHALLEGPHLLAEALDAGLALETVLVTPEFAAGGESVRVISRLARAPLEVDGQLLSALTDADAPRGCLAVARLRRPTLAGLDLPAPRLAVFLDGVQDPGNLGAIARVSEAFGAAALLLSAGCCHPNHPRALRASAGSLLRLPVGTAATPGEIDRKWGARRSVTFAALATRDGRALPPTPPVGTTILVLGAERGGFGVEIEARLDARWTIPLAPPVESLNVAVAAGIALHALSGGR